MSGITASRAAMCAVLTTMVASAAPPAQGASPAATGPAAPASTHLALLRAETDLARRGGFYLRLDPAAGRLSLLLEGVSLEEYPVDRLELGVPRIAFVPADAPPGWEVAVHTGGQLEPARERDRLEIVAPAVAGGSGAAPTPTPTPPPIPALAEEAYSVPARFRVRFGDGVSLDVVTEGGGRNRSLWQRGLDAASLRWDDWRAALGVENPPERVRLRVRLAAEDAAELYRSLPPDVALLVAPEPPGHSPRGASRELEKER